MVVAQDEEMLEVVRQLGHRLGQREIDLARGPGLGGGEDLLHDAVSGLAAPEALAADGRGDGQHPRAERAGVLELGEPLPRAQEGFLGEVLGGGALADAGQLAGVDARRPAVDQPPESGAVAPAGGPDQRFIIHA